MQLRLFSCTMSSSYFMKPLHFGQVDHRVSSVLVIVGDDPGLTETEMIQHDFRSISLDVLRFSVRVCLHLLGVSLWIFHIN